MVERFFSSPFSSWGGGFIGPFFLFSLIFLLEVSCSSLSSLSYERMDQLNAEAKPKGAAYTTEGFFLRQPRDLPVRQPEPPEFYFRRCVLISRKPYPDPVDYRCRDVDEDL